MKAAEVGPGGLEDLVLNWARALTIDAGRLPITLLIWSMAGSNPARVTEVELRKPSGRVVFRQ